jgi:hypothetical protein
MSSDLWNDLCIHMIQDTNTPHGGIIEIPTHCKIHLCRIIRKIIHNSPIKEAEDAKGKTEEDMIPLVLNMVSLATMPQNGSQRIIIVHYVVTKTMIYTIVEGKTIFL